MSQRALNFINREGSVGRDRDAVNSRPADFLDLLPGEDRKVELLHHGRGKAAHRQVITNPCAFTFFAFARRRRTRPLEGFRTCPQGHTYQVVGHDPRCHVCEAGRLAGVGKCATPPLPPALYVIKPTEERS